MNITNNNAININKFPLKSMKEFAVSSYEVRLETNNGNDYNAIKIQDNYDNYDTNQFKVVVLNAVTRFIKDGDMVSYSSYSEPKTIEEAQQALIDAVLKVHKNAAMDDSSPF